MSVNKAIILAGGNGSRLLPMTRCVNKHLLAVYDKPMIYYPLTTLINSGITDILIITRPIDTHHYQALLGNGECLGINIEYADQESPGGLPEAFLIGESFIGDQNVCLMLGDNVILNHTFDFSSFSSGCLIFGKSVQDPSPFGVLRFNDNGELIKVEEKPVQNEAAFAIPGIYLFDADVVKMSSGLKVSSRNELEISDLINAYLVNKKLNYELLLDNIYWEDMGTVEGLFKATLAVKKLQQINSKLQGSPEAASFQNGLISKNNMKNLLEDAPKSTYSIMLKEQFLAMI